jgi:serine/threonine protein kinase
LEDYDKSRILLAKLEHHKDIVVKIGDDESIRSEYEYAKKLYKLHLCTFHKFTKHPTPEGRAVMSEQGDADCAITRRERNEGKGFVKFICYFECNDNFLKYPDKERNYLCNGEGSRMKIIAMPYFELGSIGSYEWNSENIHVLRTCIKHAVMTNISAFMHGFLHGDFHPGNVLLKKTKQSSIDYLFEEIGEVNIETNGVRTWIMDFENTREISAENPRDIMDFYFDIQKFFTLLQDHRFIKNIDKSTVINIFRWVNKYMNSLHYPNMDFIMGILDSIDKIGVI